MTQPERSSAARWGRGLLTFVAVLVVGAILLWLAVTLFFVFIFPTPN